MKKIRKKWSRLTQENTNREKKGRKLTKMQWGNAIEPSNLRYAFVNQTAKKEIY